MNREEKYITLQILKEKKNKRAEIIVNIMRGKI